MGFVKKFFRRANTESDGIVVHDVIPVLSIPVGTNKETALRLVAKFKGIPVESVTRDMPLGQEVADLICMNIVFQLGVALVINHDSTVGDLLWQIPN